MTPTLDLSLNDHNGVVVRRHPLTRDQRLNVRSGSEADATEANVRFDADFVEILFGRALWLHRGENHFATQLIANPDSKNHRGDKRYSTGDVCSPRPPTKSTQSATSRPSARQEAILYTRLRRPHPGAEQLIIRLPETSAHFPPHVHLDQRELLGILRADLVEVGG